MVVLSGWRVQVEPEDREFIAELLSDWKQRVSVDPERLFEQISALSVGPLRVQEAGSDAAAHPAISEYLRAYLEL